MSDADYAADMAHAEWVAESEADKLRAHIAQLQASNAEMAARIAELRTLLAGVEGLEAKWLALAAQCGRALSSVYTDCADDLKALREGA